MKIVVGCDHGGFELKNIVAEHLKERGIEVVDVGPYTADRVDYPIYGKKTAEALMAGEADLGMVFCGSGIGISMAANKVKGVRCALVTSVEMAKLAKQHNNANMLSMGGRLTDPQLAIEMTDAWLDEEFAGAHHIPRVEMLNEM